MGRVTRNAAVLTVGIRSGYTTFSTFFLDACIFLERAQLLASSAHDRLRGALHWRPGRRNAAGANTSMNRGADSHIIGPSTVC